MSWVVLEHCATETPFQALLEAAPDAIVIVDGTGQIVLVNEQAEQLFGYDRAALIGQMVEVLLPERLRHEHTRYRGSYFTAPHTRPMPRRRAARPAPTPGYRGRAAAAAPAAGPRHPDRHSARRHPRVIGYRSHCM
jgi:PAS domain-containing protein